MTYMGYDNVVFNDQNSFFHDQNPFSYRLNDAAGAGSRAPKSKKSTAYGLNDAAGTRGPQKKEVAPEARAADYFLQPLFEEKSGAGDASRA